MDDLDTALALARPLLDHGATIVGYWRDGRTFVFDVEPVPLADAILIVRDGAAGWEPCGPVANPDGGEFDDLVRTEPQPLEPTGGSATSADEPTP